MYVNLLQDIHEEGVDLGQEAEDEDEGEEEDEGVGSVPGQLQGVPGGKAGLVETDLVLKVVVAQPRHQQAEGAAKM